MTDYERDRFDVGDDSRFYVNREYAFALRAAADGALSLQAPADKDKDQ